MAGRPQRRARLAAEAARQRAQEASKERRWRVLGMIALTLILVLWYVAWAIATSLLWCGRWVACRIGMEDLLERLVRSP